MSTTLLAPAQWARAEFALTELGDQRRMGRLLALMGQQSGSPQKAPGGERRSQRLWRGRQPGRWAWLFEPGGGPPMGVRWFYTGDGESVFYEPMQTCRRRALDFII